MARIDPLTHESHGVSLHQLIENLKAHDAAPLQPTGKIELPGAYPVSLARGEALYFATWIRSQGRDGNWLFKLLMPPDEDGFMTQVTFYQQ